MNMCCNALFYVLQALLHCAAHFFFFTFILILCAAAYGDALQDIDMRFTAQKLLQCTTPCRNVLHKNKCTLIQCGCQTSVEGPLLPHKNPSAHAAVAAN